ncbi:hypothetical protein B566_EDAN010422 [Ephemera danica]|nr:hypothetical protein B566_EDAN010422 [Ephemera danica]
MPNMDENQSRGYIQLGKNRNAASDIRFTNGMNHLSPPTDYCNFIYMALVLAGVGFLLPYNSFIIAVDYFQSRFPGTTIVFDMSLVYILMAFLAVLVNNLLVEVISLNKRITFGYIVSFFTLLFVATCEIWWNMFSPELAYKINLVAVAVVALGCTGAAGLFVSANRILTKLMLDDQRYNTTFFFGLSALIVTLCFTLHMFVRRSEFVLFYLALCDASNARIVLEPHEDMGLMDPLETGETTRSQYGVLKLQTSPPPAESQDFPTSSAFSFANPVYEPGVLASIPWQWSRGQLLGSAAARVLLVPLLLLCAAPRYRPFIPGDGFPMFFSALLGLSNGVIGSVPMIQAPGKVPEEYRELTGNIMTLSYNLGLALGSSVAYLLDEILGPPILDLCALSPIGPHWGYTMPGAAFTTPTTISNITTLVTTLAPVLAPALAPTTPAAAQREETRLSSGALGSETTTQNPTTGPTFKVEDVVMRMGSGGVGYSGGRKPWSSVRRLAYFVTLCLYPGIEAEIVSCRFGSWMPVILMAIFNAADLLGKVLASIPWQWSRGQLLGSAAARVLLVPLLLLCAAPRYRPFIPGDGFPMFFSALLGLSNGVIGSVPMIQAPGKVPEEYRELTGNIMTLSYNLGLALGSSVAYLLDEILGPPILDLCALSPIGPHWGYTMPGAAFTTPTTISNITTLVTTLAPVLAPALAPTTPAVTVLLTSLLPAVVSNGTTMAPE